MDALLAGVEVAHELADAALGVEDVGLAGALVDALDVQALVEVGQLLETLLEGVVGEFQHLEDLLVGLEAHRGAVAVGLADDPSAGPAARRGSSAGGSACRHGAP